MIKLDEFTYYELESLAELVESKIETEYSFKARYPSLYDGKRSRDNKISELMLLKVKIEEHLKTLPTPSNVQRIKDGKSIK